jgi:hypothetical protein
MWHFPIATSTSWGSPDWPRNLNFPNRPVRTRMPGGVAGVLDDLSRPLCRSRRSADAGTTTWAEATLVRTYRPTGTMLRCILWVCTLAVIPWTISCSCATSQPGNDDVSTRGDLLCNRDSDCEITNLDPKDCCAQCREPYSVAKAVRAKWCLGPTNCLMFLQKCEGVKKPSDYTAVCSRHQCERRSKWW